MTTRASNILASGEMFRQAAFTASSASAFGLSISDILRHGLVQQTSQLSFPGSLEPTLQEKLFHALANAKIWTSQVAMRLSGSARDRYFKQLDRLHSAEEWFEGDKPVLLESYKGFIRLMLVIGGNSKPALALSPSGHLVAVWEGDGQRLTVEFTDANELKWLVNRGDGHRTAGTDTIQTVLQYLQPYNVEAWFGVEQS